MTGNITYLKDTGEPFLHCHITIADRSLSAFTGHLFSAIVSVTLEVFIRTFKEKVYREQEPGTQFKFWQL
jgi:predicted DNA-binding protein with PD1-like motif